MAVKRLRKSKQMLGIRPVKEAAKGPRGPKGPLLGIRVAKDAVKGIRK